MNYFCYCKKCGHSDVTVPSKLGLLLCERCSFIMQQSNITEEEWNRKSEEEKADIQEQIKKKYRSYVYYRISDNKIDYALMKDEQSAKFSDLEKFFYIGYSVDEWEKFSTEKKNEILKSITAEKKLEMDRINKERAEKAGALQRMISEHLVTNGYNFEGYRIKKYLGIVCGECVLGTGFLSSLNKGFADVFGGESHIYGNKLKEARDSAQSRAIIQSIKKGGNALIGVDIDYVNFSDDVIGVIYNGTSVIVEKIEL